MRYFFDEWDKLRKGLLKKNLVFFVDYDGTLAPIVETPDKALMTQDMREVLIGLSKFPRCHLTIISGRKLADLKNMIDIQNITYVGNHGFEVEGPINLNFESLVSIQYEEDLALIKNILMVELSAIQGVWIEDKGIILTAHFRLATGKVELLAKKIFMDVCQNYLDIQRVSIMEGKKVLEVRPPIKWDKGEAALWILSKWQQQLGKDQITTMYMGDDFTDEYAFKALNKVGITIKVGEKNHSSADYYLKDQEEVTELLRELVKLKKEKK